LSGELNSGYVHLVIGALGNYNPDILAMVEEGNQVFAKLPSHGIHQGELLGVQPTGRHVWCPGMPVFRFDGPLIRDLCCGDVWSTCLGHTSNRCDGTLAPAPQ